MNEINEYGKYKKNSTTIYKDYVSHKKPWKVKQVK